MWNQKNPEQVRTLWKVIIFYLCRELHISMTLVAYIFNNISHGYHLKHPNCEHEFEHNYYSDFLLKNISVHDVLGKGSHRLAVKYSECHKSSHYHMFRWWATTFYTVVRNITSGLRKIDFQAHSSSVILTCLSIDHGDL